MTPIESYQMLYDFVYRVAKWPMDIDVNPIHGGMRAFKLAVEQNDILRRDLDEQARIIISLRKQIEEMRK